MWTTRGTVAKNATKHKGKDWLVGEKYSMWKHGRSGTFSCALATHHPCAHVIIFNNCNPPLPPPPRLRTSDVSYPQGHAEPDWPLRNYPPAKFTVTPEEKGSLLLTRAEIWQKVFTLKKSGGRERKPLKIAKWPSSEKCRAVNSLLPVTNLLPQFHKQVTSLGVTSDAISSSEPAVQPRKETKRQSGSEYKRCELNDTSTCEEQLLFSYNVHKMRGQKNTGMDKERIRQANWRAKGNWEGDDQFYTCASPPSWKPGAVAKHLVTKLTRINPLGGVGKRKCHTGFVSLPHLMAIHHCVQHCL